MPMSTEDEDAMTGSFSASTFDAEVSDPWGLTAARGLNPNEPANILTGMPLPQIYTTAFDLAGPQGGKITVVSLNKILGVSGLPPGIVDKILNIVVAPTRSRISKGECSVALALVAMAQKNMDLTIENLTTHREDLPVPHLPGLDAIDFGNASESAMYSTSTLPRHHPVNVSSVADPWRNSTIGKGANPGEMSYPPPPSYLASPPMATAEIATPSGTTLSLDPEAARQESFQWFLSIDTIRISFAPEKEGFSLFRHVNYVVESKNRQTSVIRRYSDFWWLLEILTKRFPFRILPNLPPKRLGVADDSFLERRIRGLTRFMNALMRHPVLRHDPLVVSFLTEPVELALWKKNVYISTEDEFTSKMPIPEGLAGQIPFTLDLELETVKRRLPASIEYYRSMVHVLDRVQKRTEATAADYMRFSLALNALADCEKQCHIEECYNCGQLSTGYGQIARHVGNSSQILEDSSRATQRGMVESLKRHRDLLVSVKELFQRRDLVGLGVIEALHKRIKNNEAKLKNLRATAAQQYQVAQQQQQQQQQAPQTPQSSSSSQHHSSNNSLSSVGSLLTGVSTTLEAQIDKLTTSIESDKFEIEHQRQRAVLLQHTMWMELSYYHKNHAFIATMYQNFVHEQMKSSQSLYDNWKGLSPIVHDLPMDCSGFL